MDGWTDGSHVPRPPSRFPILDSTHESCRGSVCFVRIHNPDRPFPPKHLCAWGDFHDDDVLRSLDYCLLKNNFQPPSKGLTTLT